MQWLNRTFVDIREQKSSINFLVANCLADKAKTHLNLYIHSLSPRLHTLKNCAFLFTG
ncbi:hypothetical protein ACOBV9_20170 (plasmid) [Pseudoalteromonas espejiana]